MTTRRLGHFELRDLLGEGAMGRVYRAQDLQLDRPVAIKLLTGRTLGDPTFLERFKREARLAAQLNHPNIATIYAFGEDAGEAYIAMEFVEGETLAGILTRGPLAVPDARRYGHQTASALAVAHAKGIIHRDIKPGNLMVTPAGDLKVMDFGVARRSGETELTMAGSLIGTANIMAPELVQGQDATPAADLFSLGCVLYEMLTGVPAFDGETAMAVLFRVVNSEAAPLEKLRPDVPPDLREIVTGLLTKDPARRLGPASAVADRLAGGAAPAGTLTLPGAAPGTMVLTPEAAVAVGAEAGAKAHPGGRRRPARLLLGGLAVVSLLAAAGLWVVLRGGSERRTRAAALNQEGELLAERYGANPDSMNRAFGLFTKAVETDSTYAPAWNNLGILHRGRGDATQAEKDLRNAARVDPDYAVPRYNLGQLFLDQRRWPEADQFFGEALALDPKYAEAHWGRARLLEDTGDTVGAIASYRRSMAANREFFRAPNDLGYLYLQAGEPESALAVLEPAVSTFSKVPALWKNLGEARRALGKLDEADSAYVRALELEPRLLTAQAGRARVAEARGDIQGARNLWTQLLSVPDPRLAEEAAQALDRMKER